MMTGVSDLNPALLYPALSIGLTVLLFVGARRGSDAFRHGLSLIVIATGCVYIVWRAAFTVPTHSPVALVVGLVLLVTEAVGFAQAVLFNVTMWALPKDSTVHRQVLGRTPRVDVLVVTYNEPVGVLRHTLAACSRLAYPRDRLSIYVCDDGSRPEVRRLAAEFGATWLTREDHRFAKAGNLNHALRHSSGEFVVVLDADMAPRSTFLDATLGHFRDEDVAFVQTPQAFYNEDPFQRNTFSGDHLPNEQDFFMRVLEPGKSRFNAAVFIGSNAVFRRSALDAIGGFATGVITEDMATGMLLQAKGFSSVAIPNVLASGLAPESWRDLLRQRDRWCRGNIQCARRWNPLTLPGFTAMQRWMYADGIVYWFFGVFKLVYIVVPLLYLLFGVQSFRATIPQILVFWLPMFVGSVASFHGSARGNRSILWSHLYETAMAPSLAWSAISEAVFRRDVRFAVTPKGVERRRRVHHWGTVVPHAVLLAATVLGVVLASTGLQPPHEALGRGVDAQLPYLTVFWALFNAVGLVFAFVIALDEPRYRVSERTRVDVPATVRAARADAELPCTVHDLSDTGARLRLGPGARPPAPFRARAVSVPAIGTLPCSTVWTRPAGDGLDAAVVFDALPTDAYARLVGFLVDHEARVRPGRERRAGLGASVARAVAGVLRRLAHVQRAEARQVTNLRVTVLRTVPDGGGSVVLAAPAASVVRDMSASGCLIDHVDGLRAGEVVRLDVVDPGGPAALAEELYGEVRWVRRGRAGLRFR